MNAHILLVEDDETTRFILTTLLTHTGYQVISAPDGKTAIQLIEERLFDVVVSDIQMREVDGIAVLEAARKRPAPPEVILLTGHGSLNSAIAALRLGAFHYLLKPCDSGELLVSVADAVQRRTTERRRVAALRAIAEELTHLSDTERAEDVAALVAPALESMGAPHGSPPERPPRAVPNDQYMYVGDLCLDLFRHTAVFAGQPLHLTRTEFTLLSCLAATPGRVLNCPAIVRQTHNYETDDGEAQMLLRGHIRNLRRKIPSAYLVNVRGTGYMLVDPGERRAPQRGST